MGSIPTDLPPEAEDLVHACRDAAAEQGEDSDRQRVIDRVYDQITQYLAQVTPQELDQGLDINPAERAGDRKLLRGSSLPEYRSSLNLTHVYWQNVCWRGLNRPDKGSRRSNESIPPT